MKKHWSIPYWLSSGKSNPQCVTCLVNRVVELNLVGSDVIFRLLQQKGIQRLVNSMDYQNNILIRKLSLILLVKLLNNHLANQAQFCQIFNTVHSDESPIIVLNGGLSAFVDLMIEEGPEELIHNLKDSNFVSQFGQIIVAESIFEYPYRPRQDITALKVKFGLDPAVEAALKLYPDPGEQIVGFFLTPLEPSKRSEILRL